MSVYKGFSVSSMLYFLSKYCEEVSLQMLSEGRWRLYCLSDEIGEYEGEGSLLYILSKAFAPFADKAKLEKKTLQEALKFKK